MIAQLYFFGFASQGEKSFDLWVLLDWPRTVWETIKGNINHPIRLFPCLYEEAAQHIKPGSVDLVLTDPPYLVLASSEC